MENIRVQNNKILISRQGDFVMDLSSFNDVSIIVESNIASSLLIKNFNKDNKINLLIKSGSEFRLSFLLKETIEKLNFSVNIEENCNFNVYCADFSKGLLTLVSETNLLKTNSKAEWHVASLSTGNDKKDFEINIKHNANETSGKVENYGVAKDTSKLEFKGTSWIANGAKKSKARQQSRIMVFDEESKGKALPILKIDENDIEASHAATVGKIADEQLFYLTSRGISESEAKALITRGYLSPVTRGFSDEKIVNEIYKLIEERM